MGFDKTTYVNEYKRSHYFRLVCELPPEYRDKIDERASALGVSRTQYIKDLIAADLNITSDNVKTPDR